MKASLRKFSRRRRYGSVGIIFSLALLTVAAYAVHNDGFFELGDGAATPGSADILGDAGLPGPDWDDLYITIEPSPGDPNARIVETIAGIESTFPSGVRAVFLADDLSQSGLTDRTIFSGSNKNDDLVSTWNWSSGNNPPKDDVSNAYAYAVLNPENELIVYAGLERLAPNGASHIDFEFNQDTISLDEDIPCGTGSGGDECNFIGEKTIGDLLVNMDFDQGGNISSVVLRQWDGTTFAELLALVPEGENPNAEGCNAATGSVPADALCAFANGTAIPRGNWPTYESPGASLVDTLEAKAFTEIGINITEILGSTPCLGTIQAKSRSSTSFNSELKDFALGNFDLCGLDVVKACTDAQGEGGAIDFSGSVENIGIAALDEVQVADNQLLPEPGLVDLFDNADCVGESLGTSITLGPGEMAYYCDSYVPSVTPSQNDVLATGTDGTAVFSAEDSATCDILTSPAIEVAKACTDATTPGGDIGFTGSVSNTGDVTLNDVSVFDDQVATDLALFDSADCLGTALGTSTTLGLNDTAYFCGSYTPGTLPSTNTVDAAGSDAINPGTVTDQDWAECSAPARLTLVKQVTNDDGGTAKASDWTLTADCDADADDFSGTTGVNQIIQPSSCSLSETGPADYTAGDWSCDGGTQAGADITLAAGDDVTCTIVNDDDAPQLKLVKMVLNDDGGLAVANDWTLSANAAAPDDGRNFNNPGGSGVFEDVFANASYNLAESALAGYTAGNWSCDGGTQSGASITLGLGDSVTCTIINDDIAPTLKLVKLVTNDDGGLAVDDDWTLTANAAINGSRDISTAGGSGVFQDVFANDAYALNESGPAGYTAGNWSCVGGGTQSGASITLGLADSVTCTIINDDIAPRLRVIKTLIPADDPGQFNLRINGTTFATGGDGADTGFQDVDANVQHTVDETAVAPAILTDYVITIGGDCAADGTITLGLDEEATCTITNVKKGMVEIVKLTAGIVDPTFEWTFILDGPTAGSPFTDTTASDPLNFGGVKLIPDAAEEYTVCEVDIPSGWTTVWSFNGNPVTPYNPDATSTPAEDLGTRCFDFTVAPGDDHVFTIDNIPPPGGDARTIGYWRNWSSCSGGRQYEKAEAAGFGANGFWVIDEVLPQYLGLFLVDNCEDAVNLVSKRTINGDNAANDGAYALAAQLLAAKANLFAGASFCPALTEAVSDADALLVNIVFDGQGEILTPREARGSLRRVRMEALDLAAILDSYNNNMLCL